MPYQKPCPNRDADHPFGWRGPSMLRVYSRPTVPVDPDRPYGKTKRRWLAVGWICPSCDHFLLDKDEADD